MRAVVLTLAAALQTAAHQTWTEKLDELTAKQQFSNGKHFSALAINTGGRQFGTQVWWKEASAFQCAETAATTLPGDWGSCHAAAEQGACKSTEFSISEICCKTCCAKHGDAFDSTMEKAFGPGATCKQAGEKGYCTKNHEIKRLCCKSCEPHIAAAAEAAQNQKISDRDPHQTSTGRGIFDNKNAMAAAAFAHLKKHGKNTDLKAPTSTEGTVWWKLPNAFKCDETAATEVPKWGSCASAKAQGGCTSTEFSIKTICCKSCCTRDLSDAEMQRFFQGDTHASCSAAAKAGLCTKDHNIKTMCCKTCQGLDTPNNKPVFHTTAGGRKVEHLHFDVNPPPPLHAKTTDFAVHAKQPEAPVHASNVHSPTACKDSTPEAMEKLIGKGANCPHAKSQGACKHAQIAELCCESCGAVTKPGGALGTCSDMPDVKLKEALGTTQDVSCRHAGAQGGCVDAKVAKSCCQTCTKAASTPASTTNTCTDAPDTEMVAKFQSNDATCPDAANAGACKHAEIAKMCCASCKGPTSCKDATDAEMVAKFASNDASCPDAVKAGACKHAEIAAMCCASCKKASAPAVASPPSASPPSTTNTCTDASPSEMVAKFQSNDASCPGAARAGACKHEAIAKMCCVSCRG